MIAAMVGFGLGFLWGLRAGAAGLPLSILAVAYIVFWQVKLQAWFRAAYGVDWVPAELLAVALLPVSFAAFIAAVLWWLAAGMIVAVVLRLLVQLPGKLQNG